MVETYLESYLLDLCNVSKFLSPNGETRLPKHVKRSYGTFSSFVKWDRNLQFGEKL